MTLISNVVRNIRASFAMVRRDVAETKFGVSTLKDEFDSLKNRIAMLERKLVESRAVRATTAFVSRSHRRRSFVGSRGGGLFHDVNCFFAKNVRPKNKVVFSSRAAALNRGFRQHDCVRR